MRLIERHGLCPPMTCKFFVAVLRMKWTASLGVLRRARRAETITIRMQINGLQLNADQTEFMWCSTAKRLRQLPMTKIRTWSDLIKPSMFRDLGVFIDADLSMRTLVQRTLFCCFAVLRQLRSVRGSLPPDRLTYCTLLSCR